MWRRGGRPPPTWHSGTWPTWHLIWKRPLKRLPGPYLNRSMRNPKTKRDKKLVTPLPPNDCAALIGGRFKTFHKHFDFQGKLPSSTSNQRDELVIGTESESQRFPVDEESAVNGEEEESEKIDLSTPREWEDGVTWQRRESRSPSLWKSWWRGSLSPPPVYPYDYHYPRQHDQLTNCNCFQSSILLKSVMTTFINVGIGVLV